MGFGKRLFGGKPKPYVDTRGLYFYVQCDHCGTIVRVRADKMNDLSQDDDGRYTWHKTIVDNRCFRRMQTVVTLDRQYNVIQTEITGGQYVTAVAWEAQQAATVAPETAMNLMTNLTETPTPITTPWWRDPTLLIYILVILGLFSLDRFSKQMLDGYLAAHGPVAVTSWLTLQATYNRGVAFGLFQGIGKLVGWMTVVVLSGMLAYLTQIPRHYWLMRLGLALIIGGASGNLIDRLTVGAVLDFFVVSFIPWIFNVGDIAINTGFVLLIIGSYWPRGEAGPTN